MSSATRVASSNCFGCARRNGAQKSSSRSCLPTASAISLRPWPAETQNRPDDASMILSPRSFHRYIPSARTTICGSALNSRLGVNGIQYSSSEMRLRRGLVLDRQFGMAHRGLLRIAPGCAARGGAGRHCARINPESYTFVTGMRRAQVPRGPASPRLRCDPPTARRISHAHRRSERDQGPRKSRRPRAGERAGSWWPTATRSSSSTTPGRASAWTTTRTARRARRSLATAAEVFAAADMIVKVKEPQAVEREDAAQGPDPVHVSASRARSRAGEGSRRERRRVHRLRDRHVGQRRLAVAGADVGGRGPHGRAGRRVLPREAARRPRRAAGRRARRRSRRRS